MGTSKNKTRQTLTPVSIQKPVMPARNFIKGTKTAVAPSSFQLRDWLFVALENGYIVPATSSTPIEWCAINDVFVPEDTKEPTPREWFDRMCIYYPKRRWETFTIDVENGEIEQSDVGQTFLIIGELQHINYNTKAPNGWQFRLEQVITPTRWEFTYAFDSTLSPQWPKGEDGETPTFTFSPVQTLPVGSDANAIVEKDGNNYDITFQIPAWANGRDGDDGQPGWKWAKWDTVDRQIGEVTSWWQAAASVTVASPLMRNLNLTIPRWQDGEDGLSPTPRDEWSSARSYNYLDIVRYPDQDGVGCTWIWKDREHPASSTDIPGESDGWMLLVRDGADGEQGEPGGTIVVPVEWRPGRDGTPGTPWENWNDGISPHSEWIWSAGSYYSPLSMVRADTWETDMWGNPIYWYYVTNNWASGDTPPKDSNLWDLVSKDGMAWDGNIWTTMVWLQTSKNQSGTFVESTISPKSFTFDCYTGNPEMASSNGIVITKTWHYRLFWHCIIEANTTGKKYINLARYSALLATGRVWQSTVYLATSKQGWPYSSTDSQWPWFDLDFDVQVDLYQGDIIIPVVRLQSDSDEVFNSGTWYWRVVGWDDQSWQAASGTVGWVPTFLWVQWLSKITWQKDSADKIWSTL